MTLWKNSALGFIVFMKCKNTTQDIGQSHAVQNICISSPLIYCRTYIHTWRCFIDANCDHHGSLYGSFVLPCDPFMRKCWGNTGMECWNGFRGETQAIGDYGRQPIPQGGVHPLRFQLGMKNCITGLHFLFIAAYKFPLVCDEKWVIKHSCHFLFLLDRYIL